VPLDLSQIPLELDKEALARSHAMASIVGSMDGIRLVITSDFEQARLGLAASSRN